MIDLVAIEPGPTLDDYEDYAHLAPAVRELRADARALLPGLRGRRLWMVNSTAKGGGVAEMLPKIIALFRELGLAAEWAVMGTERTEFFALTKRIHNLVHGVGDPVLSAEDRALYETVSRECAAELRPKLVPGDIIVVHDPQPLGMGAILREETGLPAIWRCHIGLDEETPETRAAWDFLRPYAERYDRAVFSAPEYVPPFLADRSTTIYPGIDPLSDKNVELSPHAVVRHLCNAGLMRQHHPVLTPDFADPVLRLGPDGSWRRANDPEGVGIIYRPVVTQISRWDRLKGFLPLLRAFVRLKERVRAGKVSEAPLHQRCLELARLILAGPDPASIADDPEGRSVLAELRAVYLELDDGLKADIAILTLPMSSRRENARIVNVLQRCSNVVVQNSIREGFGLTVVEAMWKAAAVLGTHACGIRHQIRDGIDGRLVRNPDDSDEVADMIDLLLGAYDERHTWGRRAQRRAYDHFFIFRQLSAWLKLLSSTVTRPVPEP